MSCSPRSRPPHSHSLRRVDEKIIIQDEKPIREETHQDTIVHETTPSTARLTLRGGKRGLTPLVTVCACASSTTQIDSGGPSISSEREAGQAPGVVVSRLTLLALPASSRVFLSLLYPWNTFLTRQVCNSVNYPKKKNILQLPLKTEN